jgi:hypothetical protein
MTVQVTLSSRIFPSGAAVPGGFSASLELPSGANESLTVPSDLGNYAFRFWDVDGELYKTEAVSFTVPGSQFPATAWYILTGPGGGSPGVSTVAFSPEQDVVIPDPPIASVSPASDQTGPTSASTESSGVVITPEAVIYPYGKFRSWFLFGAGTAGSDGKLSVPEKQSTLALALYAIPRPDPCQSVLEEIASMGKIPAGTLQETNAWFASHPAAAEAWKRLLACQHANGEPETPPTVNGQPVTL